MRKTTGSGPAGTRRGLPRRLSCLLFGLLALLGTGCEHEDAVLGEFLRPPAMERVSLSRDVQPLFSASCAVSGCHTGDLPEALLRLDDGFLFDPQLGAVGVESLESPGMLRIEPGLADASYLVAKLEGRQDAVGGYGDTMPLGAPPLSPEAIALIRQWIDDGAQDN